MSYFPNRMLLTAEERATMSRWARWSGAFYMLALAGLLTFAFAVRAPVKAVAEPAQQQQQQTGTAS